MQEYELAKKPINVGYNNSSHNSLSTHIENCELEYPCHAEDDCSKSVKIMDENINSDELHSKRKRSIPKRLIPGFAYSVDEEYNMKKAPNQVSDPSSLVKSKTVKNTVIQQGTKMNQKASLQDSETVNAVAQCEINHRINDHLERIVQSSNNRVRVKTSRLTPSKLSSVEEEYGLIKSNHQMPLKFMDLWNTLQSQGKMLNILVNPSF